MVPPPPPPLLLPPWLDMDAEMCGPSPHFCYLLVERRDHRPRTYVGYTVNPWRRLRQHNGEIRGGACATRSSSFGWDLVALVGGFRPSSVAHDDDDDDDGVMGHRHPSSIHDDHRKALQFEWRWKHVLRRRRRWRAKRMAQSIGRGRNDPTTAMSSSAAELTVTTAAATTTTSRKRKRFRAPPTSSLSSSSAAPIPRTPFSATGPMGTVLIRWWSLLHTLAHSIMAHQDGVWVAVSMPWKRGFEEVRQQFIQVAASEASPLPPSARVYASAAATVDDDDDGEDVDDGGIRRRRRVTQSPSSSLRIMPPPPPRRHLLPTFQYRLLPSPLAKPTGRATRRTRRLESNEAEVVACECNGGDHDDGVE